MRASRPRLVLVASVFAALAAACADVPTMVIPSPAPPAVDGAAGVLTSSGRSINLVKCTGRTSSVTAGTIGPLGGVLSLGAFRVKIPEGAVLTPTLFTMHVPESDIAEVEVTAAGIEHFVFEKPVQITISYDRCQSDDPATLSAWYVAPVTREPLEYMGGTVDRHARTLTFSTGHLSGYAIAD